MTRALRRTLPVAALAALALALLPGRASATWSVIAVDARSGIVVIASATCVSAEGLGTRGGLRVVEPSQTPFERGVSCVARC